MGKPRGEWFAVEVDELVAILDRWRARGVDPSAQPLPPAMDAEMRASTQAGLARRHAAARGNADALRALAGSDKRAMRRAQADLLVSGYGRHATH